MRLGRTQFAALLLALSLACAVPQMLAGKKDKTQPAPDDSRRALHALNRLTFGPRPGDVQQVMAMGVDRWIDQQLHPDTIDDSALDARLAPFLTLRMSTHEIAENFPDQQEIRKVMEGRKPMPGDATRRAIYEVQIARIEERKELEEAKSKAANGQMGGSSAMKDRHSGPGNAGSGTEAPAGE